MQLRNVQLHNLRFAAEQAPQARHRSPLVRVNELLRTHFVVGL